MEFCVRKRQSVEFEWNSPRRQQRSLAESGKIRSSQKENFMSSHSISALVTYKRTEEQSRALQDVQNEFVEPRRERTRSQEELLRKEKALRNTQIRGKHEMRKMQRAQVQQVDEFSMQKIKRKSRDVFNSSLPNCSTCKNRRIL